MVDTRAFKLEQHPGTVPACSVIAVAGPMVIEHLFKFQEAWRSDSSNILIFDLGGVIYIDSSLIGSLVMAHVHLSNAGRKMVLAGVPDRVRQMLAVTKVDILFTFFTNVAEAEAALTAARASA